MIVLYDRFKKPAAYVYHNAILQSGSLLVIGLILGDCVYGVKGLVKGKFFRHVLYNKGGEIVATRSNGLQPDDVDTYVVLYQAWQLLGKIREYHFPWIKPLQVSAPPTIPVNSKSIIYSYQNLYLIRLRKSGSNGGVFIEEAIFLSLK